MYKFGNIHADFGRIDLVAYKGDEQFIIELKVGGHFKINSYMAQLRKYVKHREATAGLLVIFDAEKNACN